MEYYSAIKRNTFESVLMKWMNLESITQREISQKKNKYCILTHIYGIQNDGTDKPFFLVVLFLNNSFTCILAIASVVSNSLQPHGLQSDRILCPWDSSGKNSGMGCHALLQGIFQTQGSNLCLFCLLDWQAGSLHQHPLGSSITVFLKI